MIAALRARPGLVLFALAIVIGSIVALRAELGEGAMTTFALVSVLAMILGEQLPMQIQRQTLAPLMTAPALGLILTPAAFEGARPSASTVLALIWVSILAGGLIARARGQSVVESSLGARFLGLAATVLIVRGVSIDGRTLLDVAFDDVGPATAGLLLLVAAVAGGLVERVLETLVSWLGEGRRLSRVLADEAGPLTRIAAVTLTAGPLIALAYPVLGWVAIPLLLLPVLLAYVAIRRVLAIRRALGESLLAMSRLSEVTGLTRPGHPLRVARLAVAIGQVMDLDVPALRQLERTALLHDIGQLGLEEPLRDGVTLHAGTEAQDRIAVVGTHVVGSSPQLATLVPLLDHVRTPFRRSREFGAHIPLESRIVRVANAWDDITEGARSPRVREVALERLHLGLGYDYDPDVVAALEQVVEPSAG